MLKTLKYLLVALSLILSLFGNYSDNNDVRYALGAVEGKTSHRAFIMDGSLNPFCILHRNEDIGSPTPTSVKTNHAKVLFEFVCSYTHVTPGFFAFFSISLKKQFANNYFRLILFPFHYFF